MDFEQFKLIINLLQDAGNLVLRVEEPTIRMAIDAARKGEAEVAALRAELICVCNLLVYRGRHAEDGKYCEICEVVARARKIAAARKGEGEEC
jgi:hypothetical protein